MSNVSNALVQTEHSSELPHESKKQGEIPTILPPKIDSTTHLHESEAQHVPDIKSDEIILPQKLNHDVSKFIENKTPCTISKDDSNEIVSTPSSSSSLTAEEEVKVSPSDNDLELLNGIKRQLPFDNQTNLEPKSKRDTRRSQGDLRMRYLTRGAN
ncbi:hypothetical protein GcM3_003006 [Golovinomyces cichoracearum]|uniref:Uncharacterized protein n=1 Tax=Golovinomyces cichoracearum TaxID=62708 RepID=A0A420JB47_9PEZI|nr:hypothetical protein GcM3_003006 [Golovinomyces cichoracearum]